MIPEAYENCGCESRSYIDSGRREIKFCPLHKAAPELLRELKKVYHEIVEARYKEISLDSMRKVIEKIEGNG